jgi:hypothetical protein
MELKSKKGAKVLVVGLFCIVNILSLAVSALDVSPDSGLGSDGLALINPPKVQDGTSFITYVVVLSKSDGQLMLSSKLPNGFHTMEDTSIPLTLKAYEPMIISLNISVKKFVAEQDHILRVELTNDNGELVSSAQGSVNVWWDWSQLAP